MPQTVQVGGDTLEFPDGMSDTDIHTAIQKEYGQTSASVPNAPITAPVAAPTLKPDQGLGLQWGIKRPLDNLAIWAEHGINSVTGGKGHEAEDVLARDQARIAQAATEGRKPGSIGDMAGSVISGIPVALITKNPWAVGAMMGAAGTKDPNNAAGVAGDAALGAGLGKAGQMGMNAIGATIAPKINPLIRGLLDKKVELTPGQILGGLPHRVEDATRSIFGLGDMVIGAQNNANKSFAKSAIQQTLDPIGEKLSSGAVGGHAQVAEAGNKLSGAYNAITADIDRVAPGKASGVVADTAFGHGIRNLRTLTAGLGADQRNTFEQILKQQIQPAFNPTTGVASGASLKTVDEFLGKQVRDFASSQNPYDRQLSSALAEAQSQVRDLVGRQYPAHAATLEHLNEGWAKLVRIEQAARQAKGGNFTPENLRQAVVNQATGVRGRSAARGEALLQDFADSGSRVMASTVPDSGTGIRTMATAAAAAAVLGKNLHLEINPWAAGALGALSAPYVNRATGAAARVALTARPAGAAAVRKGIQKVGDPLAVLAAPKFGQQIRDNDAAN